MNWLETVLGWSPDGGSGSFEVLIALIAVLLCGAGLRAIARRGRPRHGRPGAVAWIDAGA